MMFSHDGDDGIATTAGFGGRLQASRITVRGVKTRTPFDLALKRSLDVAGSVALLILLSPVLLFIALLVKFDDGGPVFFRQDRHGLNGAIFKIFKFRTMSVAASSSGFMQCQPGDSRVTSIGKLLRRTSLDELPQLFNVLLGNMSLVGPRPHPLELDYEASATIEDYWQRYAVLPGMTGLAQVRGHRGNTSEAWQMMSRVQSDLEYVARGSVWLDIRILFSTTTLVVTGKNAY